MKNSLLFLTISSLFIIQSTYGAELTIFNKTHSTVEVRAYWGTNKPAYDQKVIEHDKSAHFSSSVHQFYGLVWHPTNSGIYTSIPITSSRYMILGARIELYPRGYFIKNFDANDVYKNNIVELGNAYDNTSHNQRMTYSEALRILKNIQ